MNELVAALRVTLGNTFAFYFKAQSYHWNVEGMHFNDLHAFFGTIYTDMLAEVDAAAEQIRVLDEYAPKSIMELYSYKTIMEDQTKPETCFDMIASLVDANDQVKESYINLFKIAEEADDQGLVDFAGGLIDSHSKLGWMLKMHLKGE